MSYTFQFVSIFFGMWYIQFQVPHSQKDSKKLESVQRQAKKTKVSNLKRKPEINMYRLAKKWLRDCLHQGSNSSDPTGKMSGSEQSMSQANGL